MKISKYLRNLFAALFWLLIWHFTVFEMSKTIEGAELLLPYPSTVFKRLVELVQTMFFWQTTFSSLARILLAFIIGAISGSFIAILAFLSKTLKALLSPIMTVIRATPIASFIILLILWIPSSGAVSLVAAVLMTAPIFWANIGRGIESVDRGLLEMAEVYNFGKIKKIRYIYIPSLKSAMLSACESGVGLAWKAGVAAEVLTRPKFAIGRMVYETRLYLETADLFAWTAVVVVLSLVAERGVRILVRRSTQDD